MPVLIILALYPFSHFPLLPYVNISPFQFLALGVALVGGLHAITWLIQKKRLPEILRPSQPLFWAFACTVWLTVSLLWGNQTTHELYYIALLFVGIFFAIGVYGLLRRSGVSLAVLSKMIIIAGVVVSIVALWQFVGESNSVSTAYTGICPTCLQHDIGFARPSGFSQEPEHFSTVLMAPLIISFTLLLGRSRQRRLLWVGMLMMVVAFLLSASRSGFIALAGVLVAYSIFAAMRGRHGSIAGMSAVLIVSGCIALAAVAWSGTVGDRAGSAYVTERYIAHATGGLIVVGEERDRLNQVEATVEQKVAASNQAEPKEFNYITEGAGQGPSGAIAYSAQSRLETYKTALSIWTDSPRNFMLGVGWGSFGKVAQQRDPTAFTKNTIVNNQYLQIAVELGLIGIVLVAILIWKLVMTVWQSKVPSEIKFAIFVLFGAYGIQLLFYSGLHLLQFWLSAAVVAYILVLYEKKARLKKAV